MSAKNCIFKVTCDKDNDDQSFMTSPCFEISSEVKLKEIPTTGEEYLLSVIKERKNCLKVTKCEKDYSHYAKNQSCFVEEFPRALVPEKLKPTIEWQNIQVADFSDMRMYISRLLNKKSTWPIEVISISMYNNSSEAWKNYFKKKEPTLTSVLGLPHSVLDCGIKVITHMLGKIQPGQTVDHKTGQWIYAILACIRLPLLSDTISILRNLARQCAEIRSHINPDDENAIMAVTPLNIFICLIARYFRQYDLAD